MRSGRTLGKKQRPLQSIQAMDLRIPVSTSIKDMLRKLTKHDFPSTVTSTAGFPATKAAHKSSNTLRAKSIQESLEKKRMREGRALFLKLLKSLTWARGEWEKQQKEVMSSGEDGGSSMGGGARRW